jgi:hypothetical protein
MKTNCKFNNKIIVYSFVFFTLLFLEICHSADSNGKFSVVGPGIDSCTTFIETVETGKNTDNWIRWNKFRFHTLGYLTGVNEYSPDTYDIKGEKNLTPGTFEVMDSLENYCREQPDDDFQKALKSIVRELHPNRVKQRPKK